ncbi:hypothetical protein VB620_15155 [Nodularia harveyana UHCC-0300]|uniref:Uncharacterized protein n=1 Tax=Nodularia harveyana UHCC-0300 TaxID=2974287 RepID=A0ABU5UJQ7_9CYAN|nr:hypothetical protein [Nodularia harveyana]MEA5582676.1 hypothetical protein [Nodularia harveyana UHCC-0300]
METPETIKFPGLSLAVYREIAAHLRQVEGIQVGLIPQASTEFDYHQSQVAGLQIFGIPNSGLENQERVQQILAYYRNCYSF